MKHFLPTTALAVLISIGLAVNVPPSVGEFPFEQSWKISTPQGHGSMFPIQIREGGVVFLTAKHVTQHMKHGAMAFHPEYGIVRSGVKVLFEHPTRDLATVFVPIKDKRIQAVQVALSQPKVGDRCIVVAYPGPGHRRITGGFFSGNKMMSAQIVGGSSGGPVFTTDGHFVGVVRAVDVRRMNFGIMFQISFMGYYEPVTPKILRELLAH